jgi:signal transduction histidine kinase
MIFDESQGAMLMLDLTRERGKLQLDQQDVDLHLIVRSAVDICQREASAKLTVDLRARGTPFAAAARGSSRSSGT